MSIVVIYVSIHIIWRILHVDIRSIVIYHPWAKNTFLKEIDRSADRFCLETNQLIIDLECPPIDTRYFEDPFSCITVHQ